MYKITCICLLLLITGCSMSDTPAENGIEVPEEFRELDNLTAWSADNPPEFSIRFEDPHRFGEVFQVMAPTARGLKTAVDGDGNVYLADMQQKLINVYHPDGTLKEQIGREGRGPGEFTAVPVIGFREGRLITYDISMSRIQKFSLDPVGLEHIVNTDPTNYSRFEEVRGGFLADVRPLTENTYLTGVFLHEREDERGYNGYYVMDDNGNVISEKVVETMRQASHQWTLENGMVGGIPLPYTRKGILAVSDEGLIYTADTGHFLIRIHHPEEGYRRAIYYPFENDPLEREEIQEMFNEFRVEKMLEAGLSDSWPALESMMVDDENRIWVSTIVADKEIYRWWVLNGDGSLLGQFDWTRDEDIELVKDGHMYVREKDPEQGIEYVVRYRIELQQYNSEEVQ